MQTITKAQLLASINTVVPLKDYDAGDCIFSQKYAISPVSMVYIIRRLSADFNFPITDDFIDRLEMCTFGQLAQLVCNQSAL